MFVHVIGHTMYTKDLYMFVNENFDKKDHVFVTGKAYDSSMVAPIGLERKEGDVEIVAPKNIFRYISILNKCDGIILHGVFSAKHLLLISRKKEWLEKTCWVLWGGDIYCHNKKSRKLKDRLAEKVKLHYAPFIGYIAPITEKDFPLAQEWYGIRGKKFLINYPTPLQRRDVLSYLGGLSKEKETSDPGRTKKIIIGNSATVTNCHKEAFEILSAFKDENICIYIPLSYGFSGYEKYAEEVIHDAESIFGRKKIVPLTEKMDGEEYAKLLGSMDVAVFYNDRQQAMGNIAILLAAGTKIFIRDDTSMWKHYLDRGYQLENAFKICNMDFDEFCRYDEVKKENNVRMINKYVNADVLKAKWEIMFDDMRLRKGRER